MAEQETVKVRFVPGELPPGNFNLPEPCPDCARLRALLGEAKERLEMAMNVAYQAERPWFGYECDILIARIAKELEVQQ